MHIPQKDINITGLKHTKLVKCATYGQLNVVVHAQNVTVTITKLKIKTLVQMGMAILLTQTLKRENTRSTLSYSRNKHFFSAIFPCTHRIALVFS